MANLLTTDGSNGVSEVITEEGNGFVSGVASGKKFAFSTKPGNIYQVAGMETDAAAVTWSDDRVFLALVSNYKSKDGSRVISSSHPVSLEISSEGIKYGTNSAGKLTIGSGSKPKAIVLNGKSSGKFTYDSAKKQIIIDISEGEGLIKIN